MHQLFGTHEDERTVLYKSKSVDGTKPNNKPKTNPNPNTNTNRKLTQIRPVVNTENNRKLTETHQKYKNYNLVSKNVVFIVSDVKADEIDVLSLSG